MAKIIHIIAQAWSILLYPLWIPTYGMLLLWLSLHQSPITLSNTYWWICIGATFLLTAVQPLIIIVYLWRQGVISDLYIEQPDQRLRPYQFTAICYAMWCYVLYRTLHMPLFIVLIAIGALLSLIIVMLINRKWKISAHLNGMGGLIGGIASYHLCIGQMPTIGNVLCALACALLLMYARLYLRAHTGSQVVAGFLLGMVCTFIPNLIYSYVQTI